MSCFLMEALISRKNTSLPSQSCRGEAMYLEILLLPQVFLQCGMANTNHHLLGICYEHGGPLASGWTHLI